MVDGPLKSFYINTDHAIGLTSWPCPQPWYFWSHSEHFVEAAVLQAFRPLAGLRSVFEWCREGKTREVMSIQVGCNQEPSYIDRTWLGMAENAYNMINMAAYVSASSVRDLSGVPDWLQTSGSIRSRWRTSYIVPAPPKGLLLDWKYSISSGGSINQELKGWC